MDVRALLFLYQREGRLLCQFFFFAGVTLRFPFLCQMWPSSTGFEPYVSRPGACNIKGRNAHETTPLFRNVGHQLPSDGLPHPERTPLNRLLSASLAAKMHFFPPPQEFSIRRQYKKKPVYVLNDKQGQLRRDKITPIRNHLAQQ